MKRATAVILFGCFLIFPSFYAVAAQNFSAKSASSDAALEPPLAKPVVGEKLFFDVYWMTFHVGFGSLEVKEEVKLHGREAYHVIAIARTNDFLSKIYPIRDEIHSFIDAEKFRSLEFRKTLQEGRYRADERVVFDHNKKKGLYRSFLNKSEKEIGVASDVNDLVSAFYWFRSQNVPPGKSAHILVNSEEKDWDLEMQVLQRETKAIRGRGNVDTILVEPKTRLKGILYDRGRAWINFSTDKTRTPVLITIKTQFGPVRGALRKDAVH